jgi:RHS repeat-associated protein
VQKVPWGAPGQRMWLSSRADGQTGSSRDTKQHQGVGVQPPADRLGWLGAQQRYTSESSTGLMRMGVRLYGPTVGRFLEVDPIERRTDSILGSSANDYSYVSGDPINWLDLDGKRTRTGRRAGSCGFCEDLGNVVSTRWDDLGCARNVPCSLSRRSNSQGDMAWAFGQQFRRLPYNERLQTCLGAFAGLAPGKGLPPILRPSLSTEC